MIDSGEDLAAPGRDQRPFVGASFLSTIPQSDSWHRFGWTFALAYIRTYLSGALGRRLLSLFPTLSSVGAALSRPYLPLGLYQASLGHPRFFHTVSPAHTLVR